MSYSVAAPAKSTEYNSDASAGALASVAMPTTRLASFDFMFASRPSPVVAHTHCAV
jgi:hypothetical protein